MHWVSAAVPSTGEWRAMASRSGLRAFLFAVGLVLCGIAGDVAWRHGLWGLLTGAVLAAFWLAVLIGWELAERRAPGAAAATPEPGSAFALRLLLDALPTPLVAIEGNSARVLNRAGRRLFAADDRIVPAPAALLDADAAYLAFEGRRWRIDRVEMHETGRSAALAALIDIEEEERAAEARASAELIQILGHELLNGLSPIVSLAESGLAASEDPVLLREILGTLARRAEGLQRFTAGYRALARLPAPAIRPVGLADLAADLGRLFAGRWPQVMLEVDVPEDLAWPLDRDQVSQAVWALLQNAAEAVSPDHGAAVRLRIQQAGTGIAVDVQDNGAGIPPDAARKIFRPFHTSKPEGTGIGLSLARQVATAHGGSLTLEPGAATTFRLWLPA